MKKFYTLLAASAVVFAASAEGQEANSTMRAFQPQKSLFSKNATNASSLNMSQKQFSVAAIKKAPDLNTLEGDWEFLMGDLYFGEESKGYVYITYEAKLDGNTITFNDPFGFRQSFIGTYDEDSYTISFQREDVGLSQGFQVYQQPFEFDWNTMQMTNLEELTGSYDPGSGLLSFDIGEGGGQGLSFEAFEGDTNKGLLDVLDFCFSMNESESINRGKWNDVGMAKLTDGWLQPGMGYDQYENVYEVPLQQKDGNENLYRLVNPYKRGPLATSNKYIGDGYIGFDVSDPDHVVFIASNAGYSDGEDVFAFFCYNYLGMLATSYPQYSLAEIIDLQDGYNPWTTFKDGKVSLTSMQGNRGPIYDANFGYQFFSYGGMVWSTQTGGTVDMNSYIEFPGAGVEGIEFDENAPVEYFNLQGVRVTNPEAGQLLIKRQGAKTAKVIVK